MSRNGNTFAKNDDEVVTKTILFSTYEITIVQKNDIKALLVHGHGSAVGGLLA